MKGRKPKPLALKIASGTPAVHAARNDAPYPPGSTEPPDNLEGHALAYWHEMAPQLAAAGLLAERERGALMALCLVYAKVREDPNLNNIDCYRRMLNEFGLTPAARPKVQAPADALQDDLQDFLDKPKKIKA